MGKRCEILTVPIEPARARHDVFVSKKKKLYPLFRVQKFECNRWQICLFEYRKKKKKKQIERVNKYIHIHCSRRVSLLANRTTGRTADSR